MKIHDHIQQHNLYDPAFKLASLSAHPTLLSLYIRVLHHICIHRISSRMIEAYLPAISLYLNVNEAYHVSCKKILCLIVLLTLLNHQQLNDPQLKIKQNVISDHLHESGFWFRYRQQKQQQKINLHTAIDFVAIYMQITYVYQGFRDVNIEPILPHYFEWIYDAFTLYEWTQSIKCIATKPMD